MAANIASTSFSTTPDNKAVVVDIYGAPPLAPTNNSPARPKMDIFSSPVGGLAGGFSRITNGFLADLTNNFITTGKLLPDKDKFLKNLSDGLKVNKGVFQQIGGNFMNQVMKSGGFYESGIGKVVDGIAKATTGNSLEKMALGGFKDVSVTIKGVNTVIKNFKDIDSLTGLATVLNGIDPNNPFLKAVNLTEIAGVVKGVSEVASYLDITGAFDHLISKLDDDDKKAVTGLVLAGTTSLTDLGTIDTALQYLSPGEILAANPDIIKVLLTSYSTTAEFPSPSKEAAEALVARLNRIDAHWFEYHLVNDKWSSNIDMFTDLNWFVKESFISAGMFIPQIAAASSYRPRRFVELANSFYPYIALSESA